jgi:hypothetical protein
MIRVKVREAEVGSRRTRGRRFRMMECRKRAKTRSEFTALRTGVSRRDIAYRSRYLNCRNGAYMRGLYTKRQSNMQNRSWRAENTKVNGDN